MEKQVTVTITEQQKRLADALRSFPKEPSDSLKKWPEGHALYEAIQNLRNSPQKILDTSGRFLYSGVSTLKSGKFYLLGYNPGGDPDKHPTTLEKEISEWFKNEDYSFNAYLDEGWIQGKSKKPLKTGHAPLQKRVKMLLEALDADPREVCASNLFFARSEGGGGKEKLKYFNDFSVHKALLEIIRPDFILAFHNSGVCSTYGLLLRDLSRMREMGDPIFIKKVGKVCLKLRVAKGLYWDKTVTMIGLPHLSRYGPEKYLEDLKKIINEAARQRCDSDGYL